MSCWVIIPVKPPEQAKMRLAGALNPNARAALVGAMLRHVAQVSAAADHVDRVCLLGPSRHGLPDSLPLLDDPGGGLNPALQSALAQLSGEILTRLIVLPADLPMLSINDVQLLASAPPGTVAIAPDRHGTGTNALSLPLPGAGSFTFAFGADSFARHQAQTEQLGLKIETIHSNGLARDIDVPGDLPDAAALMMSGGPATGSGDCGSVAKPAGL